MLPNEPHEMGQFRDWVTGAYGADMWRLCKQRIDQLPPDKHFDPQSLVWECYCKHHGATIEVVHQMGDCRLNSELPLE